MTDLSDKLGDSTAIRQEQGLVKRLPVPRLHVVLFEPEIAANTGAIGRTCVAAGARLWLVRPLGFHLDDRHLRRAGLDYWAHLDLCVVDKLGEVAESLGRSRLWSFSTKADLLYTEAVFQPGDAFVFGPEGRGLPASWLEECPDRSLRIPIQPEARSLNLANAVAIALFEGVRQLGLKQA
ncbi:MAG TPA: tRNA (cytidine(34)-2'-O)-methyltransferase [Isosphaeraceae bacterium]|nr:tRNA (cytidine(34)-2'-O)-methyltransferase [Isosphaeraceae bacterium]